MRRDNSVGLPEPQEIKNLARAGRRGDSRLAHVTPSEAMLLEMLGGSGSINPETKLREYYEEGSGPGGRDIADPVAPANDRSPNDAARDARELSIENEVDAARAKGENPFADVGPRSDAIDFFKDLFDFGKLVPTEKGIPALTDKKTAGPSLVGLLGPSGWGALAAASQKINDAYFGGEARADVNHGVGGPSDQGMNGSGLGGQGSYENFLQGASAPFSFGPWSDTLYLGNNPTAPNENRLQFLTALNRVTDPNWRRERVGFGTGDELFDSIYGPLQQGANDYLTRAQNRGMLDIPSYNAAQDVLRSQGEAGAAALRQQLNEQGDSIIQPLRARAADLQGQIAAGRYDTTPFSDAFFNELFGGAASDVRNRASELGSDLDPFAPATALYTGLQAGGNVAGTPLASIVRQRNRSGPAAIRGIGSKGVF